MLSSRVLSLAIIAFLSVIVCQPLTASRSSTTPYRNDRLLLIHDPVPLLAARSGLPHRRYHALGFASQAGLARPGAVSSAVCVCPPPMGSLWPAAWAHGVRPCPQPVDSQTGTTPTAQPVAAAPLSCIACTTGRLNLPIHSVILSPFRLYHHSWQSAVGSTLYLGLSPLGVHPGLSMHHLVLLPYYP